MTTIVHVVGQAASGKTTVRHALAASLELPHFGIDDERIKLLKPGQSWPWRQKDRAWNAIRASLDAHPEAILETMGTGVPHERAALRGHDIIRVRCKADRGIRFRRLLRRQRQGYPLAQTRGYVATVLDLGVVATPDDIVVDTGAHAALDPVVQQVQARLDR